jgi:4-oxalomesaconate tautomerase
MNLGDVTRSTVPKVSLLSPPTAGGSVGTRTFIPLRVHEAIGVLGAVSVATACLLPGSVAQDVLGDGVPRGDAHVDLDVEHPTGFFTVGLDLSGSGRELSVDRVTLLRTARLLMRGEVLVPSTVRAS